MSPLPDPGESVFFFSRNRPLPPALRGLNAPDVEGVLGKAVWCGVVGVFCEEGELRVFGDRLGCCGGTVFLIGETPSSSSTSTELVSFLLFSVP